MLYKFAILIQDFWLQSQCSEVSYQSILKVTQYFTDSLKKYLLREAN